MQLRLNLCTRSIFMHALTILFFSFRSYDDAASIQDNQKSLSTVESTTRSLQASTIAPSTGTQIPLFLSFVMHMVSMLIVGTINNKRG